MNRRVFLSVTALGATHALAAEVTALGNWTKTGNLRTEDGDAPIEHAKWYVADSPGDGMSFTFPAGTLANAKCLTSDMLLDGKEIALFQIALREGAQGRVFRFSFGGLNQCSFRLRLDLALVDQA